MLAEKVTYPLHVLQKTFKLACRRPMAHTQLLQLHNQKLGMPHSMPAASRRADNLKNSCIHMRLPLAVTEHGQHVVPYLAVKQVNMPLCA